MQKRSLSAFILFVYLFAGCIDHLHAQGLYFNENKKFKIVQFTDVHWESGQEGNETTIAMMELVLDKERPDLVVLTGDIITSGDLKTGWGEIAVPMVERKINWIATLGNHDSEGDIPREKVYDIIQSVPYNLNTSNPEKLSGFGNFYLPVLSKDGERSAILYFFDSHDYVTPFQPGKYAWIKQDQIRWYKNVSNQIKQENNNRPVPSLAFFHIPLPEYKIVRGLKGTTGNKNEGVSSPELNSGMFSAMFEQQDMMGVFVGHDHDNDFIGTYHDIALAYGRRSGSESYGRLKLGARVINVYQDVFHFDTWISTGDDIEFPFTYPSKGLTDFSKERLKPAVKPKKKLRPGVTYTYFEGNISSVNQINNLERVESGRINNFSLSPAKTEDHFAFEYHAYIKIPADGIYQFYINSDDGAVLFIDDKEIINNDGGHSPRLKKGSIGLKKGYHKIKVLYFEDYMGNVLDVGISGLILRPGKIRDDMLFTESSGNN